jgi:hypothetical protein
MTTIMIMTVDHDFDAIIDDIQKYGPTGKHVLDIYVTSLPHPKPWLVPIKNNVVTMSILEHKSSCDERPVLQEIHFVPAQMLLAGRFGLLERLTWRNGSLFHYLITISHSFLFSSM